MAYQYKGAGQKSQAELNYLDYIEGVRHKDYHKRAACGTYGGYYKHVREKTEPCEWCRKACAFYYRRANNSTYERGGRPLIHGTEHGYKRHLSDKTKPCYDCLIAHSEYCAKRKRVVRAKKILAELMTNPHHPEPIDKDLLERLGQQVVEIIDTSPRRGTMDFYREVCLEVYREEADRGMGQEVGTRRSAA